MSPLIQHSRKMPVTLVDRFQRWPMVPNIHLYVIFPVISVICGRMETIPGKLYGLGPVGFPKEVSRSLPIRRFPFITSLSAVARRRTGLPLSPYFNPRIALPEWQTV